jgi:hypothetical protein
MKKGSWQAIRKSDMDQDQPPPYYEQPYYGLITKLNSYSLFNMIKFIIISEFLCVNNNVCEKQVFNQ